MSEEGRKEGVKTEMKTWRKEGLMCSDDDSQGYGVWGYNVGKPYTGCDTLVTLAHAFIRA